MEFWRRNLYNLWIAQFLAMAGMSMVIPFLPYYIRDLGVTDPNELEKWSGLVFSGPFVLSFILTPVWGMLGDKYGKKPMVMRAVVGLAISQLLIGLSQNVFQLFVFRMVQGGISGFIASSLALVSSNTPREHSGYAIGVLQSSISSGNVIGPMLGGFLADLTSHRTVFFITSGLCVVSSVLVYFFVREQVVKSEKKPYNVFQNYKYVFSNAQLRLAMISITLVQISISVSQPIFALFIEGFKTETQYLSTLAGSIFGVMGVFTVISSPWWGKRNDSGKYKRNLFLAITGASIAYMLHVVISNPYQLFPIRAFLGFCIGGIIPVFYSYINKNISMDRKGGVMGIASSSTLFGNLLGPLLCTALVMNIANKYIFLTAGLMMLINGLVVLRNIKDIPNKADVIESIDSDIKLSTEQIVMNEKRQREKFLNDKVLNDNK